MTEPPAISVIIITDGRAENLRTALESLGFLRYPRFEVVVVAGPTADGTGNVLTAWQGRIKIGRCSQRNINRSRNIGVEISSGEILAFFDDDAVPEPEWLDDIIPAFADPGVGMAGGFVHDHTGKSYQSRFETANRLGTANRSWDRAVPEFNFPLTFNFPIAVGTNSVFRRSAIIDAGGFDEEFDYYLEETDLICRMIDRGWRMAQIDRGFVHHKSSPSQIRNEHGVLTSWYSLTKNKMFFALINGSGHLSTARLIAEVQAWVNNYHGLVRLAIQHDLLAPEVGERFATEADQGLHDGLTRGLAGARQLIDCRRLRGSPKNFLPFRSLLPAAEQRCFVFLSTTYPPSPHGGIGRYVHQLARAVAANGHQVHVLTRGQDHDRVDFENGVWVHRCMPREFPLPTPDPVVGLPLPQHIWNYSMTMLVEAKEIAARRTVDAVHAPIWDAEGIAFLRDGTLPLVTGLHTTLSFYLDSNPERRADSAFNRDFISPMLAAERELLTKSDGFLANSDAIVAEIESAHGVIFDHTRLRVVPHGLDDWAELPAIPPSKLPGAMVRLVYVGRLEPRKGIDVLLAIAADLLMRYPEVWLDIVGDDRNPAADGRTWRESFESNPATEAARHRIAFHGNVSEEQLRGFYRAADVVIAPSRFESFGLVHLEALMLGRPVIGCRAGGMVEVIQDGRTGLLADPGDSGSLCRCIERLLADPAERRRMGEAGRADYLARFTAARMAAEETTFLTMMAACARKRGDAHRPDDCRTDTSTQVIRPAAGARPRTGPARISVIGGVVAQYDAISCAVADSWRFLSQDSGWDVSLITMRNDLKEISARVVDGLAELLITSEFLSADLLIYHFGVWNPLFDALVIGNGRARQAVFFHNITPVSLVSSAGRLPIERSFEQLENLCHADQLWPVSQTNAQLLTDRGFDQARIDVIPLAVGKPVIRRLADKKRSPIELLFVGRIVPAKGVNDLVTAVALIRDRPLPPFRLHIVGNLEYSDQSYCDTVRQAITEQRLDHIVKFVGTVDDDVRDRLLLGAHVLVIPSYHEGFCKPVIEGLRAGCVPVGYAAYNLRYVANGLSRMVPPGDIAALAEALADIIDDIAASLATPTAPLRLDRNSLSETEFAAAVLDHIDQFRPESVAALVRSHVARLLTAEYTVRRAQGR